jgi:hypothetical protein
MSEQRPPTGPGKPPEQPGARRQLNGHANGHAKPEPEAKRSPSVVVPFPKKPKPKPAWLSGLLGWAPAARFGALLGWLAVIGFAGMFWGVSRDGAVDAIDVCAGLFGVLAALWFHRSR